MITAARRGGRYIWNRIVMTMLEVCVPQGHGVDQFDDIVWKKLPLAQPGQLISEGDLILTRRGQADATYSMMLSMEDPERKNSPPESGAAELGERTMLAVSLWHHSVCRGVCRGSCGHGAVAG